MCKELNKLMGNICYYLFCCCCCRRRTRNRKKDREEKERTLKELSMIVPPTQRELSTNSQNPRAMAKEEITQCYGLPDNDLGLKTREDVYKRHGYRFLGIQLGSGKFGTVERVVYERENIPAINLACKRMTIPKGKTRAAAKKSQKLLNSAKTEVYALQKLKHPHIIQCVDHFIIESSDIRSTDPIVLHIFMQWAPKGTLYDASNARAPFNESKCRLWFAQILSAMVYSHSKRCAHRDLKLLNILLDANEDLLVTDFGLSRAFDERVMEMEATTYCGTATYMAPEILGIKTHKTVSYDPFKVDVWALGVILFILYNNTYPYEKEKLGGIEKMVDYMQKKKYTFARLPTHEIDDIMGQMLDPAPDNRPTMRRKRDRKEKERTLKELSMIVPPTQHELSTDSQNPRAMAKEEITTCYALPDNDLGLKTSEDVYKRHGYRFVGPVLGSGKFGTVERVVYERENIPPIELACKRMPIPIGDNRTARKNKKMLNMAKGEVYALRKLKHPHIIQCVDHFIIESSDIRSTKPIVLHIFMQLAKKETLYHITSDRGPSEEPQCRLWFAQILSAMVYSHNERCAHRDLKLLNLLLDANDDVLVTDFGLSRAFDDRVDDMEANTFCGSPNYMSPELLKIKGIKHAKYDPFKVDVWALGVILFVLFDNTFPYDMGKLGGIKRTIKCMTERQYSFTRKPSSGIEDIMWQMLDPVPESRPKMLALSTHEWIATTYEAVEAKG
ncbi:unnamed protein product, partial [Medioppia subpectinata]